MKSCLLVRVTHDLAMGENFGVSEIHNAGFRRSSVGGVCLASRPLVGFMTARSQGGFA